MCDYKDLQRNASFDKLSKEEVKKISNGCGATGKVKMLNWIMGVNIVCACDIHDVAYHYNEDRSDADDMFKANLYTLIEKAGGSSWKKWLRKRIADGYYWAVKTFGGYVHDGKD